MALTNSPQTPDPQGDTATTDTAPTQSAPRPAVSLYWPIHFQRPDDVHTPTPAERALAAALDHGDVPEDLAALKEALLTLAAVDRNLTTGEAFAQAAADPAHAEQYERFLKAIALQADAIRKRAHRAPRSAQST
ncbi:hypothetical protein [Streptomyces qinglanensis]|uniref:hypothetical protein n=1 Tax=Streptomyces qinglanensis TaxID=943816 RepID=UPI003D74FF53